MKTHKQIFVETLQTAVDLAISKDGILPLQSVGNPGNFAIVLGDNAQGKSLLTRWIKSVNSDAGMQPMALGMNTRAGDMTGIPLFRAMVYGNEQDQSTGEISISSLKKMFSNAMDNENPCTITLDEPEIGLSSRYHMAVGKFIGEQFNGRTEKLVGCVLTSHSATMVNSLIQTLDVEPFFIIFSDDMDAQDYLDKFLSGNLPDHSLEELMELPNKSRKKMRAISRYIGK